MARISDVPLCCVLSCMSQRAFSAKRHAHYHTTAKENIFVIETVSTDGHVDKKDNRMLFADKKRSLLTVRGERYQLPNGLYSIDFSDNIRHFWENVNYMHRKQSFLKLIK